MEAMRGGHHGSCEGQGALEMVVMAAVRGRGSCEWSWQWLRQPGLFPPGLMAEAN